MSVERITRTKLAGASTSERILDSAERLAQTRGFNGFSYADIAEELGVTKASLHYHFATKADLGRALIERYHRVFARSLASIDEDTQQPREQLKRYIDVYESVIRNNKMCLCGMLAAEYETLPGPMQSALRAFFNANEEWLTRVLAIGRESGTLQFAGPERQRARIVLGTLEGAMLVERAYGEPRRFEATAQLLLTDLTV